MPLLFIYVCSYQASNEESRNARKNLKPLILNQVRLTLSLPLSEIFLNELF